MKIISHRGYWLEPEEKNAQIAFERSVTTGFGIETDIRDSLGRLVISHDMPSGHEMLFSDFLKLMTEKNLPLAINVKADGLAREIKKILDLFPAHDYFAFDMSIPDMREYIQLEIPVFTRISEIETKPVFFDQASGIWLDCFQSEWYDAKTIEKLLDSGKRVCIVSPELHRRPHASCWEMIRSSSHHHDQNLYLCTDFPQHAKEYFHG